MEGAIVVNWLRSAYQWLDNQAHGYFQGVINGLNRFGTSVLTTLGVTKVLFGSVTNTLIRLYANIITYIDNYIKSVIQPQINQLRALIHRNFVILWAHDMLLYKRALAYAHAQDVALHQLIEREAASGYRLGYSQRIDTLTKLLDYTATRNPLVRDLVNSLGTGVIDLIGVDDPIARYILAKLASQLTGKLGVDHLAGEAVQGLLGPLLGQPRPNDLHDVVADITARLGSLESWQAQFFADGGSEVEQAGELWQTITSPLVSVAMIAFFTGAVIDPTGWANDIQSSAGTPVADAISSVARLINA